MVSSRGGLKILHCVLGSRGAKRNLDEDILFKNILGAQSPTLVASPKMALWSVFAVLERCSGAFSQCWNDALEHIFFKKKWNGTDRAFQTIQKHHLDAFGIDLGLLFFSSFHEPLPRLKWLSGAFLQCWRGALESRKQYAPRLLPPSGCPDIYYRSTSFILTEPKASEPLTLHESSELCNKRCHRRGRHYCTVHICMSN